MEERPKWGASPAKPWSPLRFDRMQWYRLGECVCAENLVGSFGVVSGLSVLSPQKLCAGKYASAET
jgi:hypothetical protein